MRWQGKAGGIHHFKPYTEVRGFQNPCNNDLSKFKIIMKLLSYNSRLMIRNRDGNDDASLP